jgi:hypothetical protein
MPLHRNTPRDPTIGIGRRWDFPSVEPPDYLRQLHPDLYAQECHRVRARFDEAVKLAEEAFLVELAQLVSHLCERLSGSDDGKPKVFRDSAVTNLTGTPTGRSRETTQLSSVLAATGPADLVVSTWTAAGADIGFASRLLADRRVTSLRFVVDHNFQSRQPAYCAALREAFGDDAIRVTKNHGKFVLVRNAAWNIVVRTLMNLNECRRLETVEISDNAAHYGITTEHGEIGRN